MEVTPILSHLLFFIAAALVTGLLIPVAIRVAGKTGIASKVDFRRPQSKPVPLLGGLPIFFTLAIACFLITASELAILLPATILVAAGLIDDAKELAAKPKFLIHVFVLGLWLYLVPYDSLTFSNLNVHPGFIYAFLMFWGVGVINAFNMIDGMDGEAGGTALFIFLAAAYLHLGTPQSLLALTLAGACVGFLFFNLPPAKIYLGEVGSTLLGFTTLYIAATLPVSETASSLAVAAPLFLLAVPEVDAVAAMIRRWSYKTSLTKGDRDHIHHKLKKLGLNVPQALFLIYGVAVYCALTTLVLATNSDFQTSLIVFCLSTLSLLGVLASIYYLEYRQAKQISLLSQTMMQRHLSLKKHVIVSTTAFHATIYDLLPYYKELQLKGVEDVDHFIQDFAEHISTHHPEAQLALYGSYTVVATEAPSKDLDQKRKSIVDNVYHVLERHQIMKNDNALPWGLRFYDHSKNQDEFFKRYSAILSKKGDGDSVTA